MRFDGNLQDAAGRGRAVRLAGGLSGEPVRRDPPRRLAAKRKAPAGRAGAPDDEARFFLALGIGRPAVAAASEASGRNRTTMERELIAAGVIRPARYYEALARMLGLPYLEAIPPEAVVPVRHLDAVLRRPHLLGVHAGGQLRHIVAPTAREIPDLLQRLDRHPGLRDRMAVAAPATIRQAVWNARADERTRETVRRLAERVGGASAATVATARQGFVAGLGLSAVFAAALMARGVFGAGLHVLLSIFFFACVALRFAAFVAYRRPVAVASSDAAGEPLPVYTIVVALHDEAAIAGQLVAALKRLDWPRALLDIKLICEADDGATIAALEALDLSPEFEIVRVPPIGPRTKPKALDYALAGARGEFLVIYDAEDRPHPQQLREAHALFTKSGPELAVIQAPLVVSNARASAISALFAMEYAGLFRGLLPFLARCGLPIPLGGTSNHFRMDALLAAGAWDPHNVTEDADLGMRLYRRGYRGAVIARPTYEDAPDTTKVWMRQRTRWFKGWLQTWLVLMRTPLRLRREMGTRGFLAFQVLIAGMLVSALGHLLLVGLVVSVGIAIVDGRFWGGSALHETLRIVDLFNFAGGYLGFVALSRRAMVAEEKRRVGWRWACVPLYWVAMSAAAWLAVKDLIRNPFYWAKTPHSPRPASNLPRRGREDDAAREAAGA